MGSAAAAHRPVGRPCLATRPSAHAPKLAAHDDERAAGAVPQEHAAAQWARHWRRRAGGRGLFVCVCGASGGACVCGGEEGAHNQPRTGAGCPWPWPWAGGAGTGEALSVPGQVGQAWMALHVPYRAGPPREMPSRALCVRAAGPRLCGWEAAALPPPPRAPAHLPSVGPTNMRQFMHLSAVTWAHESSR